MYLRSFCKRFDFSGCKAVCSYVLKRRPLCVPLRLCRRRAEHCSETRITKDMVKGTGLLENYNSFEFEDNFLGIKAEHDDWCNTEPKE